MNRRRKVIVEIAMSADVLRYFGGWADKITGDTLPVSGGFFTYTMLLGFLVAPIFGVVSIGTQLTEAFAGLALALGLVQVRALGLLGPALGSVAAAYWAHSPVVVL